MTSKVAIQQILNSKVITDVFPDLYNWSEQYDRLVKLVHPDLCHEDGADEAIKILNDYKQKISTGTKYSDDAGDLIYHPNKIVFSGDKGLLKISLENYGNLIKRKDDASSFFQKYIPKSGKIEKDVLSFDFWERAVPLSELKKYFNGEVPQEHVNWILNRIFEFISWIYQTGQVHAGITPDSIFVMPENHGLVCTSFYHMRKSGDLLTTISAKYKHFYPSYLFGNNGALKVASPKIDLTLATRTAMYLLGDNSGVGNKLRKTHNTELLDFYSSVHSDPGDAYFTHKQIINKHFEPKKFHSLTL